VGWEGGATRGSGRSRLSFGTIRGWIYLGCGIISFECKKKAVLVSI